MLKSHLFTLLLIGICLNSLYAQRKKKRVDRSPQQELVYRDKNYLPSIQSVELYTENLEQLSPILQLNTDQTFILAFDDLRADHRRFYFSLEHCNINWEKSSLSTLEYSAGYGEDLITNSSQSRNTVTPYTHYETQFPTENVKPLISGNYLLKVYEDGDKSRLILTRRFFVVDQAVSIQAEIAPPVDISKRKSHQKLNLTVRTASLQVNNPSHDIKVMIMQNGRQDILEWEDKPSTIRGNELIYNRPEQFNFPGGQEFLYLDLRSLRLQSSTIESIESDSLIHVNLFQDQILDNVRYSETPDENGQFFIRNLDQDGDAATLSEYASVRFELKAPSSIQGNIYLLGSFNNYNRIPENQLHFDSTSGSWKITKWLKQGVYDYTFAVGNALQTPSAATPNFYETDNAYGIFIYYRNPRLNRDELVGYGRLDSRSNARLH